MLNFEPEKIKSFSQVTSSYFLALGLGYKKAKPLDGIRFFISQMVDSRVYLHCKVSELCDSIAMSPSVLMVRSPNRGGAHEVIHNPI